VIDYKALIEGLGAEQEKAEKKLGGVATVLELAKLTGYSEAHMCRLVRKSYDAGTLRKLDVLGAVGPKGQAARYSLKDMFTILGGKKGA